MYYCRRAGRCLKHLRNAINISHYASLSFFKNAKRSHRKTHFVKRPTQLKHLQTGPVTLDTQEEEDQKPKLREWGLQRLRRERSASTATSSLDIFTFNIIAMEMIGVLGCCFYSYSIYTYTPMVKLVGVYIFSTITAGQLLFHILTCFERYLAVIHPVLYLGLRKASGDRLRNISIGFVWCFSFGWMGVTAQFSPNLPTIPISVLLTFSFIVTSFFSLSVLRALIVPGPGEGGRDRAGQLKRRAFHTITGALSLRFGGQLLFFLLDVSAVLSHREACVLLLSGIIFCIPSSYVLPLLFLHRDGKLPRFKYEAETGRDEERRCK